MEVEAIYGVFVHGEEEEEQREGKEGMKSVRG